MTWNTITDAQVAYKAPVDDVLEDMRDNLRELRAGGRPFAYHIDPAISTSSSTNQVEIVRPGGIIIPASSGYTGWVAKVVLEFTAWMSSAGTGELQVRVTPAGGSAETGSVVSVTSTSSSNRETIECQAADPDVWLDKILTVELLYRAVSSTINVSGGGAAHRIIY